MLSVVKVDALARQHANAFEPAIWKRHAKEHDSGPGRCINQWRQILAKEGRIDPWGAEQVVVLQEGGKNWRVMVGNLACGGVRLCGMR